MSSVMKTPPHPGTVVLFREPGAIRTQRHTGKLL